MDSTDCFVCAQGRLGKLLWRPHRSKLNEEKLHEYLEFGRALFASASDDDMPVQFSEERGLYFLMMVRCARPVRRLRGVNCERDGRARTQCDYDVERAMELLRPVEPEEKKDEPEGEWDADDFCLVCGDGGNLLLCDTEECHKAYHPGCVKLDKVGRPAAAMAPCAHPLCVQVPQGKWECPRHFCAKCRTSIAVNDQFVCARCPTAYCRAHCPPDLRADGGPNFLCMDCVKKSR
jgi:hypothetical protein